MMVVKRPFSGSKFAVFHTWLKYDLDFPTPKENVNLPDIEWNEERKQGFFDGIIAFMGGSLGKWGDLALHDHDLHFIGNLSTLSKELGYTPNVCVEKFEEESKSYRLYFSPNQVKRINLINPKHCQKGACCEVVPIIRTGEGDRLRMTKAGSCQSN